MKFSWCTVQDSRVRPQHRDQDKAAAPAEMESAYNRHLEHHGMCEATSDELWREAAREGRLRVCSHQGSDGPYVQVRCTVIGDDVVRYIYSRGSTVWQALEPIIRWRERATYCIAGAYEDIHIYLQRTVAQEALGRLQMRYPLGSFSLQCVTPGEHNDNG
jgi:hypothetical protein